MTCDEATVSSGEYSTVRRVGHVPNSSDSCSTGSRHELRARISCGWFSGRTRLVRTERPSDFRRDAARLTVRYLGNQTQRACGRSTRPTSRLMPPRDVAPMGMTETRADENPADFDRDAARMTVRRSVQPRGCSRMITGSRPTFRLKTISIPDYGTGRSYCRGQGYRNQVQPGRQATTAPSALPAGPPAKTRSTRCRRLTSRVQHRRWVVRGLFKPCAENDWYSKSTSSLSLLVPIRHQGLRVDRVRGSK